MMDYRLNYTGLADSVAKPVCYAVFITTMAISLINTPGKSVLVGIWVLVGSIVCPLIVTVLPGTFYYYVLKEEEVKDKWKTVSAVSYAIFGLILLPFFLTLSTKNLFSQPVTRVE